MEFDYDEKKCSRCQCLCIRLMAHLFHPANDSFSIKTRRRFHVTRETKIRQIHQTHPAHMPPWACGATHCGRSRPSDSFLSRSEWLDHAEGGQRASWLRGGVLSEWYGHVGPGVCLGDGQTEAEGVPSQGECGDALLRRMTPYLTWLIWIWTVGVATFRRDVCTSGRHLEGPLPSWVGNILERDWQLSALVIFSDNPALKIRGLIFLRKYHKLGFLLYFD